MTTNIFWCERTQVPRNGAEEDKETQLMKHFVIWVWILHRRLSQGSYMCRFALYKDPLATECRMDCRGTK